MLLHNSSDKDNGNMNRTYNDDHFFAKSLVHSVSWTGELILSSRDVFPGSTYVKNNLGAVRHRIYIMGDKLLLNYGEKTSTFFSFSLRMAVIPRRNEKQRLCKILGGNKVHYGRCASGVFIISLVTLQNCHDNVTYGAAPRWHRGFKMLSMKMTGHISSDILLFW